MSPVLSDCDLRAVLETGELLVTPLDVSNIQPASIDLTLSDTFRVYRDRVPADGVFGDRLDPLDPLHDTMLSKVVEPGSQFALPPRGFALASTVETVRLGCTLTGVLAGKSSLARVGLMVEAAGLVDGGFRGQLTCELANLTDRYLMLTPGMLIAQLSLFRMDTPIAVPYGDPRNRSRYQGQTGPTPSRLSRTVGKRR